MTEIGDKLKRHWRVFYGLDGIATKQGQREHVFVSTAKGRYGQQRPYTHTGRQGEILSWKVFSLGLCVVCRRTLTRPPKGRRKSLFPFSLSYAASGKWESIEGRWFGNLKRERGSGSAVLSSGFASHQISMRRRLRILKYCSGKFCSICLPMRPFVLKPSLPYWCRYFSEVYLHNFGHLRRKE